MTKINLKARFKRQSRIVKENRGFWIKKSALHTNSIFTIIFLFLVILFPVYPSIASFLNWNSKYEFYRWNIDKDSILEAYDYETDSKEDLELFSSWDDYISINTPLEDERDTSWVSEIIDYKVEDWDSIWSIANKYQVTTTSIISLNKLKNNTLKAWMELKILPVSWILHTVKSWETISHIAKKYNVSAEKINKQNFGSGQSMSLKVWQKIIIPWAKTYVKPEVIKKPEYKKPEYKKPKPKVKKKSVYKKKPAYKKANYVKPVWGYYRLVKRRPFSGAPGNCTWYVAQYKTVNWRWNANRWLRNAAAKWRKVHWGRNSVTPRPWFIVAFNGYGYNPRYWHVWIVMSVNLKARTMVVSDMNYQALWRITYRTVKLNHRAITGYIDIP